MKMWKIIDGTDGRYSVNTFGEVMANWSDVPQRNSTKRVRVEKTAILKPYLHTNGYWRINLGRKNRYYVHRLVATSFVPNPHNKPFVDHIDGDRANNHVSNLRWVTGRENSIYGGERHGFAQQIAAAKASAIHTERVGEYKKLMAEGLSLRAIAKKYNSCHSAISRAIKMAD
jgi:hypothetical protein